MAFLVVGHLMLEEVVGVLLLVGVVVQLILIWILMVRELVQILVLVLEQGLLLGQVRLVVLGHPLELELL